MDQTRITGKLWDPCPCGYYVDDRNECTCSMSMVQRYQKRISGPLMDRIDIHLEVQQVPYQKLEAAEALANRPP
ncbi:MAG: ATP-binding protein [Caldilineaceae bacterium]